MASHWVGFTFPGMIEEPRLVRRKHELLEPAPWARRQPAHVIGDLHQRHRHAAQRPHRRDHGVERSLGGELVGRGLERHPRELGDLRGDLLGETWGCVEPRSDRRAAGGEATETSPCCARMFDIASPSCAAHPDHSSPTVSGTASSRCVRPIFTTSFHRLGLRLDDPREPLELRQEVPFELEHRGDVHRGRERIVRRLTHVDVVVGVYRRLAPQLAAEQLDGAVRDDLVDVHVRLRARAGLPDVERELGVELPRDDLVGRRARSRPPSTPAGARPSALTSAAAFFT